VKVLIVVGVVCLALMMGILWISTYTGCGCGEEATTVAIEHQELTQRPVSDDVVWDETMRVRKVTPKDDKIIWADAGVIIKGSDGNVLVYDLSILPDDPALYDDGSSVPVEVQIWFVEMDGNERMGSGDLIKITGLDERYEGAQVILIKAGEWIGSITLPSQF
jgi:hypothetical protein